MNSDPTPASSVSDWLSRSRAAQIAGDFDGMIEAARQAHELGPAEPETGLRLAECSLLCGQVAQAIACLQALESPAKGDPMLLQRIAAQYTQCSRFNDAHRCHRRAAELAPRDSRCLYNLAASCIATGKLAEAERLLTEVIRLDPTDYDAWQNRSTLRRQTRDDNHVEQLRYVLAHLGATDPGRVQICYALARELEDLGQYEESFRYLQQGAMARRQRLDYDVANDVAAMELIQQVFSAELLQSPSAGITSDQPVFVLGLPRSGTTLVDRIISAHGQAASLGETNTLVFALMRTVAEGQPRGQPAAQSRTELIHRSAQTNFASLGEKYLAVTSQYGQGGLRLVDKTPLNFLYLGLIRLALPGARIIHLRRHPVDSCYAMYKTLFRMGYPFSYSLEDAGRYYIAYRKLMTHWRNAAPGSFLDVDYEKLVNDQEVESRRIIEWCGLEWDEACLEFHRLATPAATASASQVRRKMYTSSVNLWRNYERQLAPFVARLREHGIEVD